MFGVYKAYLEGVEREDYISEMYHDNLFDRLEMMYEMVCMQEAQIKKDIEYKVIKESGTFDDLAFLVTEAEAETNEQKKGILSKIGAAIASIFKAIHDFLFGVKKAEIDPEETVQVDEATYRSAESLAQMAPSIDKAVAYAQNGQFISALTTLPETLFSWVKNNPGKVAATAGVAAAGTGAMIAIKKGKLTGVADTIDKITSKFENLLNKTNTAPIKNDSEAQAQSNPQQPAQNVKAEATADNKNKLLTKIKSLGSELTKMAKELVNKLTGKVASTVNAVKNGKVGNKVTEVLKKPQGITVQGLNGLNGKMTGKNVVIIAPNGCKAILKKVQNADGTPTDKFKAVTYVGKDGKSVDADTFKTAFDDKSFKIFNNFVNAISNNGGIFKENADDVDLDFFVIESETDDEIVFAMDDTKLRQLSIFGVTHELMTESSDDDAELNAIIAEWGNL